MFVALGLGMALPFVLLAWFPGWRRVLPRPGAWMERLKQLLAFPLYATVAWLAWVLGAQVDNDAVVRLLATLVVVAFALWAWRAYRGGGARAVERRGGRRAARGAVVVALAAVARRARRARPPRRAAPGAGADDRVAAVVAASASAELDARRAGPCSSTSPRRGASRARSTSGWC